MFLVPNADESASFAATAALGNGARSEATAQPDLPDHRALLNRKPRPLLALLPVTKVQASKNERI